MHVRTVSRRFRDVRVDVAGRELLAEDKINLGPNDAAVVAYTTTELVEWILTEVFGSGTVAAGDSAAAAVLATKPWWPYVGVDESYISAIETELNSHDCRLLDLWGGLEWFVSTRSTTSTFASPVVKLGTYTTDDTHTLPDDVDPPIIIDIEDTVSRDGDWLTPSWCAAKHAPRSTRPPGSTGRCSRSTPAE